MIDLSIVIVTYNSGDVLGACLNALRSVESLRTREIVVVDNASHDGSVALARSFSEVTVVETGENLGYAGGVNRGLAVARGRCIAILNPDVVPEPGALDALVDFLETHPTTGLAAPKLLNPDGTLQPSCRRFYTLSTVLLRRTPLGKLFPNAAPLRRHLMQDYDHASPRVVDWVAGAAMIVRREALLDVGPMDERYFLYFEDVDWCTRMHARGWSVQYVPDAVMVHGWARGSARSRAAARRHLRAGLRFYDRWGGFLYVLRQYRSLWTTALLLFLDLLAVAAAFVVAFLARRQLAFILHKPVFSLLFYSGFFAASMLVYLGAFALQGLYREIKEGDWVDVAFRVAKGATLGALILMASTFILDMRAYSRFIVVGSWPVATLLVFLVRRSLFAALGRARRGRWTLRRVGLWGADPVLDRLEETLLRNPELGWEPVRLAHAPGEIPGSEATAMLLPRLARERLLAVVVSPASLGVAEKDLPARVLPLRRAGYGVWVVSSFIAALPPRARLETVGDITWLALEKPGLRGSMPSKRVLDLAASGALLLLGALPALAVILARGAAGKRILEPGTPLTGRWGEEVVVRRLAAGGRLRSYPLLPGVVGGRWSLVGPRPLRPGEAPPGGDTWQRMREHHRPGLVGPWSLHRAQTPEEEMQQELRYLEDWSPEADMKLLARVALLRGGDGGGPGSAAPRAYVETSGAPLGSPR